MSILSNKGRVIPSLDNYASPAGGDLLIVQDMARNQTRNITFSQVSETLATLLQGKLVNFTNANNKFTGSFKGGFANFLDGKFSVKDAVFSASGFPTIKLGTLGATSTITLNTSNITLNTPTVVVGQLLTVGGLLTASGGVAGNVTGNVTGNLTGNVTGDVKGDIYDNGGTQKILDNRTNRTALFRGSSSYASRSLSSSHALVADVTYTCLSHTTTADFATSARSASYASQSRSSSYLRYTGIPNGSSSYALKSGYALSAKTVVDIPDRALTASYLLWNATVGKNNGSASFAHTASYAKSSSYARSASYAKSSSYARTASYVSPGGSGILASYSISDNIYAYNNNTDPLAAGATKLAITITPKSAKSKFLINVSVNMFAFDGSGPGIGSLYKNDTAILNNFAWSDNIGNTVATNSATYIDTTTDLSARIYSVKFNVANAAENWHYNAGPTSTPGQPGTYSTMTILEFVI